jgi:hypothetical protein
MARLFFNKTNIFLSHDSQSPATATSMQQHIHSSISCPAKTLLTLLLIAISNFAAAETRCDRPAATLESAEGAVEWTTVSTDDWQKAEAGATFCQRHTGTATRKLLDHTLTGRKRILVFPA